MWIKENMPDQTGKTVIVTGSNVGVGFETALAFYEKGAHVLVASRSVKNVELAIDRMQDKKGKGSLEPGLLDLSDLRLVNKFADSFLKTQIKKTLRLRDFACFNK